MYLSINVNMKKTLHYQILNISNRNINYICTLRNTDSDLHLIWIKAFRTIRFVLNRKIQNKTRGIFIGWI